MTLSLVSCIARSTLITVKDWFVSGSCVARLMVRTRSRRITGAGSAAPAARRPDCGVEITRGPTPEEPPTDLGLTTWGFAVPDGAESQAASNTPALDTRQHTQAIVRSRRCVRSDRKSTRLNSSHLGISYAVFCLKKKKKNIKHTK